MLGKLLKAAQKDRARNAKVQKATKRYAREMDRCGIETGRLRIEVDEGHNVHTNSALNAFRMEILTRSSGCYPGHSVRVTAFAYVSPEDVTLAAKTLFVRVTITVSRWDCSGRMERSWAAARRSLHKVDNFPTGTALEAAADYLCAVGDDIHTGAAA